jgi:hypothetical protein
MARKIGTTTYAPFDKLDCGDVALYLLIVGGSWHPSWRETDLHAFVLLLAGRNSPFEKFK